MGGVLDRMGDSASDFPVCGPDVSYVVVSEWDGCQSFFWEGVHSIEICPGASVCDLRRKAGPDGYWRAPLIRSSS